MILGSDSYGISVYARGKTFMLNNMGILLPAGYGDNYPPALPDEFERAA